MRIEVKWAAGLVVAASLAAASPAVASPSSSLPVTEYYNGHTYTLSPDNWHGAKDCAITSPTVAHCFDTDAEFNAYTDSASATAGSSATTSVIAPAATGTCNGFAKIWSGAGFTGTGLAFQDYGTKQSLSNYVPTPFKVVSWFTDGERSYSPMTNCYGVISSPGNLTLTTDAEATNLGSAAVSVSYIQLYKGTK